MSQVFADGVAPVHIVGLPAISVMLKKKMILTVEKNQTVRIVAPTATGGKMKSTAQRFNIQIAGLFECITLFNAAECF